MREKKYSLLEFIDKIDSKLKLSGSGTVRLKGGRFKLI